MSRRASTQCSESILYCSANVRNVRLMFAFFRARANIIFSWQMVTADARRYQFVPIKTLQILSNNKYIYNVRFLKN